MGDAIPKPYGGFGVAQVFEPMWVPSECANVASARCSTRAGHVDDCKRGWLQPPPHCNNAGRTRCTMRKTKLVEYIDRLAKTFAGQFSMLRARAEGGGQTYTNGTSRSCLNYRGPGLFDTANPRAGLYRLAAGISNAMEQSCLGGSESCRAWWFL